MPVELEIRDVSPRDGLQDLEEIIPTGMKVELIRRLWEAGLRSIEATSFVSPKVVPQLADAEELFRQLQLEGLDDLKLSAFVATEGGLRRAVAAGADEASTAVPATDGMTQANFRRDSATMLGEIESLRSLAPSMPMSVTIAVAFGCPFDGPVDDTTVLRIADRLVSAGYETVILGDTVGVGNPRQVRELFSALASRFPDTRLGAHLHDPRGFGLANVVAAVEGGATMIDASLGGLGGCPFAPGAAGNVASEDVVWLLADMGYDLHPRRDDLRDASRWLETSMGLPVSSRSVQADVFEWERNGQE